MFEPQYMITNGFRILDKKQDNYWAALIVKNYRSYKDDRVNFVRAFDGLRGAPYYIEECEKCLRKEDIIQTGDTKRI